MKRTLAAALAAAALLIALACGVYAVTKDDSLISLSYLEDVFLPDAKETGEEQAWEELEAVYDAAADELDQVQEELLAQAGGDTGLHSSYLSPRDAAQGDRFTVGTGAGFMLFAGMAKVSHDGAFVDVTEGAEVPSGSVLVSGHRYLAGEDTTAKVTVTSGIARVGVQGGYEYKQGKEKDLPFYDVSLDDWYCDAVGYVYRAGLLTGVGDGKFEPHRTMDRAMLMTAFYRLAGSPTREMEQATAVFDDVKESDWFHPFVRWAATQEITAGMGENQFGPYFQLTREQVVTLLQSFATRYMGQQMDGRTDVTGYSDYERSSQWARDALSWAVCYGILDESWAGENTLGGHLNADRAEVSAMLSAFAQAIENIR
jgi:hypothetical protein